MFVIKRVEDGAYVAPLGSRSSYTFALDHARTFPTQDSARKEKCGNEIVLPVEECLQHPD